MPRDQFPPLPASNAPAWREDRRIRLPGLTEDATADVTVVGAGIAGLTTALLLARRGIDVVVLEGREVGAGTTGRSTAKVSALQGTRYRQIVGAHGAEVAQQYAAAQEDARRWMGELVSAEGLDCTWEERTAATFSFGSEDRAHVEEEAAAATAAGLPVRLVDRCADLPFEHTGAVELDGQAQFDPMAYLGGLVELARATGHVRIHEGTRATKVRGTGSTGVQVQVQGGSRVRSGHVVVATLLPILDRGFHFATCEPAASYSTALEVDGPIPETMYLSAGSPGRSLRAMSGAVGERLLVVGGAGHRVGKASPTTSRYEELVEWAATHFPVRAVRARWFAHDQVPVDHLPFAGAVSRGQPNVLVAGGFAKWGMTNGTAAAMVLDAAVAGVEAPSWAAAYATHRPSMAGAKGTLVHNAETFADMATGWLKPSRPKVVCTHLGGVCGWNDAERTWDCPLHGSRYDEDGTVVAAPTTAPMRRLG